MRIALAQFKGDTKMPFKSACRFLPSGTSLVLFAGKPVTATRESKTLFVAVRCKCSKCNIYLVPV